MAYFQSIFHLLNSSEKIVDIIPLCHISVIGVEGNLFLKDDFILTVSQSTMQCNKLSRNYT